jgi:hypothetical protein
MRRVHWQEWQMPVAVVWWYVGSHSSAGFYLVIVVCLYYGASHAEHDHASRSFFVSFLIIANQVIDAWLKDL